jgi:hypothetical protein
MGGARSTIAIVLFSLKRSSEAGLVKSIKLRISSIQITRLFHPINNRALENCKKLIILSIQCTRLLHPLTSAPIKNAKFL